MAKRTVAQVYYRVLNDGILGAKPTEQEARPDDFLVLKGDDNGIISASDLRAAGVDIDFQVKAGTLVEVDYIPRKDVETVVA